MNLTELPSEGRLTQVHVTLSAADEVHGMSSFRHIEDPMDIELNVHRILAPTSRTYDG